MTARERFLLRDALAMLLAILLAILCVWAATASAEMTVTVSPLWQKASAGPYGTDLRGTQAVIEGRVIAKTMLALGGLQFQSPQRFSGTLELTDKQIINATEFEKGAVSFDGQVSLQRAFIGVNLSPWAKPYLCAEGLYTEWNARQEKSGKVLTFTDLKSSAFVGGGLRVDAAIPGTFILCYGDGSLTNGHNRFEAGLEWRYQRYFIGAFGRHDRFNAIPATINGLGIQAGMEF